MQDYGSAVGLLMCVNSKGVLDHCNTDKIMLLIYVQVSAAKEEKQSLCLMVSEISKLKPVSTRKS